MNYHLKAHAKLNLYLHVNGKENNYHLLDSLVVFCDAIYDELIITDAPTPDFSTKGAYANKINSNILVNTIETIQKYLTNTNFAIQLNKNIPIGSGLGGGSADAAALIRGLQKLGKLKIAQDRLNISLKKIGADVSVCYYNKAAYLNGIGEKITPIKKLPTAYAVILFPDLSSLTKDIFAHGFKSFKNIVEKKLFFTNYEDLIKYLFHKENDLYNNTLINIPGLEKFRQVLNQQEGCDIARMTGSGSAIFGLFKTQSKAIKAQNNLKEKFNIYIKHTGLF